MRRRIRDWLTRGDRWARGRTPWTPLPRPLSELRLALISSGGVYVDGQPPFDTANPLGDWSIRLIPGDAPTSALRVAHGHYDHAAGADRDVNVVFPLDRLREIQARGAIGELSPVHVGFMGYIVQPARVIRKMAPQVVRALKDAEVDAALMVPV